MRNLFSKLKKDKTVYKILSCKRRDKTLVNEVFISLTNKVGGEQLSTVLSLLESVVWWA